MVVHVPGFGVAWSLELHFGQFPGFGVYIYLETERRWREERDYGGNGHITT